MARALSLLAVVATMVAAGGACRLDDLPPPSSGSVDFGFIEVGDVAIASVDFTISGNAITPIVGTISLVDQAATPSAVVGGIPAGIQYLLELRAMTTDGKQQCYGATSFDVVANESADAMIVLVCSDQMAVKTTMVNGMTDYCPWIASYAASSSTAEVDGSPISVSAIAASYYSDPPMVRWTASSGTLATPTASVSDYRCTTVGPATITVTITDGYCPDTATLLVTCVAASRPDAAQDDRLQDGGML
jgi:hypothetical protein